MKILVYKRTHDGDPSIDGEFGNEGCMGRIRGYNFDAVIGVGGIGNMASSQEIARKLNWVGRKPKRSDNPVDARGPLLNFSKNNFRLFEQNGPPLSVVAPLISNWVETSRGRFFIASESNPWALDEATDLLSKILDERAFDHLQLTKSTTMGGAKHKGSCNKTKCRCD